MASTLSAGFTCGSETSGRDGLEQYSNEVRFYPYRTHCNGWDAQIRRDSPACLWICCVISRRFVVSFFCGLCLIRVLPMLIWFDRYESSDKIIPFVMSSRISYASARGGEWLESHAPAIFTGTCCKISSVLQRLFDHSSPVSFEFLRGSGEFVRHRLFWNKTA